MKVLITGGHTQIPIDQVRVISNIFKGRTAIDLSYEPQGLIHPGDNIRMTVVGNPDMEGKILIGNPSKLDNPNPHPKSNYVEKFIKYKTYDDLYSIMKEEVSTGNYDVIIHSAAVSDYYVYGSFTESAVGGYLDSSTKISSSHDKLFLELRKTRKIIDDVRNLWGFKGLLVKFKLQVGISDQELLEIARQSRIDSKAEIIVANCLEWAKDKAYIITDSKEYSVNRKMLANKLFNEIRGYFRK